MSNIDQHIERDRAILDDQTLSPQMRRHTAEELEALEAYKSHHPEDEHAPTSLELFCDKNPGAVECLVYDD